MKRHLRMLLVLAAVALLPWTTQAQGVSGCAFTTGVDNTKWVTLSSSATEITAIYDDDAPSSCINIGFDFYFGGNIYTQFSCNSNGRFRLGPTAVSNYWTGPFTTLADASYNDLPFVTAFGADNTLTVTGNYVKYELVGTAPNRILVVEYYTSSEYNNGDGGDLVNYQIQLVEDSNRVRLVYGTTAATTYDDYQIGIAGTATDFLMVNATTHATLTTPTTFANDGWPGAGRYYEFTMGMPPSCPAITGITVGHVTVGAALLSWTHGVGNPVGYGIEYYKQGDLTTLQTTTSTTPHITLTGLDSNTTYVVRVRANCGSDGYGAWDSTTLTTESFGCVYDPASIHTLTSGTGTSQTSGVPVNSSWGNTLCQGIYTAAELIAAGFPSTGADITDLTFTWTNNSSYAKYFTIYMVNTTKDVFSGTTATEWVSTGASAKVYEGAHSLNTSGDVTYHLTTPFHWDGTSNICVTTTMNQPSGASHSSSGFYGYSTTLSSYYRTLYKYQDSNPLDGSNPAATAASSRSYYRTNITFLSQTCIGQATCAAPVIWIDSMTAYEAYLSWVPGFNETSWDVQYRVKGTTAWTTAATGTTATTATVSSLTPGTHYEFRVVTVCTSETHPSNIEESTTECVPIAHTALPFTYGFEDLTTGSGAPVANCWARGYYSGSYNPNSYPYASTSYYHSGSKSLYFYASGTTIRSWVCLPEFEDSINTLRLQFWAKKSGTSYSGLVKVGVMTDPTNVNTFQTVYTDYTDATTNWNHFEFALGSAPTTGRITIMVEGGSGTNYMYVDDITVDEIPYCTTPVVDSLIVTTTDADIYLSDIDHAQSISVTLTAGTWDTTVVDASSPISIYGLTPGTTYSYSIVANCGSGQTSGIRTGSFTTLCTPIAHEALPLEYGFEDLTSTGSGYPLAACWDRGYLSGSTFYSNNYPYSSSSYYQTGTRSLYFYGSGTTTRSWLCLPEFEDSIYSLQVSFWGRKTSTSYNGRIIVGVMTDPHTFATFQPVDTVTIDNTTSFVHFEVPLTNAPGTGYITIMNLPGSGSNYFYLDDIHVDVIPTCLTPMGLAASNIGLSTATLTWHTRTGTETAWLVGNGTTEVEVYDTNYVVTGLMASSTNTVTVRALCGDGDTSEMAYLTVTTPCGLVPPYSYGFEDMATTSSSSHPNIPCWHHLNNGTSYPGYPYITSTAHTGTRALYWYGSTTQGTYGDYYYVVLPMLDTANYAMNTMRVKFWARASSTGYHPIVRVGVMTDPTNVSTFQAVNSNIAINPGSSTDWAEFTVDLDTFTGNGAYIAIGAVRPSSLWYMYMDDISVVQIPDCDAVSNFVATNITTSQADLSWIENGTATFWNIEYGPHGFTPGSSAGTSEVVYTLPHTLYGLTANTEYDVYITPDCYGTAETAVFSFRTECAPMITLPYTYGFEDLATGSTTMRPVITCWHHLNNSSSYPGYPYVSSTAHTGSRSLYWYNPSSSGTYSDYQTVVLPAIDTDIYPINTLQLKFWAKASSTSYSPIFQVGVMTDPNDVTTFQRVQTINVGSSAQWAEYVAGFGNYTGSGQYIALHVPLAGAYWYGYTDDFTIELAPQCPPITNMAIESVGTTGAMVTWEYQPGTVGTPQEYEIEWVEVGSSSTPITATDTMPYYFITGLDTNTTYKVRVRGNCYDYDYGGWDSITFTTTNLGCAVLDTTTTNTINFSNGTTTYSGTLVYSSYGNTMYQTIYTADELSAAGISAGAIIGVDFGFGTNSSYAKEFTIFIGSTNMSSFSSATAYVNPGTLQQVYGPAAHPLNTSGWQHYNFTQPFVWDGSSNIIICTFMNQPTGTTHTSSSFSGYYTTGPTNTSLYRYKDSNPFTLANYTTSTGGSVNTYRASVHFYTYGCGQRATCAAPMVRTTRVDAYSADVEWAAGLNETAWDVEYRVANASSWTSLATGTTNTSVALTGLTPATTYEVRVSYYCSTDDTTYYGTLSFTTPCAPYTIPFTENFDSYVAGSSSQLGPCWNKYYSSLNTASYPYPYASYQHSGSNCLYFYGYSSSYPCWLVLPEFADSIRSLELSFWEYKTTSSYGLVEIGVITDPEDLTTFVPVDTVQVQPISTWQQFFVNFLNYQGPEGRIAMVARTSSSYTFYIDDIEVGRYSTCPRVQNLAATRLTNDSAYVSWQGDSAATFYRVWWSSTDNFTTATDSVDLTDANIALGWLGPNTTVYMWVSQACEDGAMSSPVRLVFTTAANCEVITDLYIYNVTATSAVFTWNEPQSGYAATWYRVSWQTTSGIMTDSTPNPFYFLTGLDTASSYTFSVVAFCPHAGELDSSFAVSKTFTTSNGICNYIAGLGTSTSTSSAPVYVTYPYYYGHMLFFAEELAQMGDTITSLTFNVTTSGSVTRNVDVYLGNSDYENLYTPTFPPLSTLTQVYSGNWTISNGQCTINFTTPFVRDHSRNLVVGFDDNTGTANSSSFSFSAAYTTDRNTGENIYTVHYNEAQANVNPATDDAVHVTYVRPIITFGTSCADESCSSPAAVAYGGTDTTINLTWNANSGSSWRVEYRLPTDTVWTVADSNVTTNNYVLGGLRVATRYAIRVGSICSADNILYTPIFGETACGDALVPYTDDFDDIVNGWYERTCWRVGNVTNAARSETSTGSNGSYNYPRVVNLTQHGPMLRLYNGAYAVMPHFAEPLHNLQVRFDYYTSFTTDAWCLFGYLPNPNDINSLVVIDTLRHGTLEGVRLYTINLDQLADDADGNLCFVTPHTINYTHIDNIIVDVIPPCAIPDSLRLVSAIDTSADLTWYMSNIGSANYMVRYTAYRSGVYDTVYSNGTTVSLNGLIPGTTYDAECYSICLRTGDTSQASNICRFTTDCAPLPTLPYIQTFEDIPLSTTQTLPNCWEIAATNTTVADNLPHCIFDNPNAAAGYYYVYIASESAIAMPEFVAPADSLQISFYLKTSTAGSQVEVGVIDTLVPFVSTAIDTFTTSSTGYEFFSAYMVGYTGPGNRIYIRTLSNNAVYIDNLVIDYAPTCLPVRNLRADTATSSTLTLAWRDLTAASQYEVEYGTAGFTHGTGTTTIVTTNPATILGLSPMTNYDFYVRPICSVGDTGEWSGVLHAATALCDHLVTVESWDSAWTSTTSSYAPMGYSLYNYGYVQTIIDSARFVDLEAEISAFAFNPAVSTAGSYYNHIDIYMANVSESSLSAGFIMPDSNHHFVQVLNDADLSYSTVGWQMHSFDTTFTWDGHSNVLFVVNRRHGAYTSGASFNAHSTSTVKTRYIYQDASQYDPATVTGGTTLSVVGDLKFFSCAAACDRPNIASVTGDHQSATLNWVGNGTAYEVSYRTAADTQWSAPLAVTGSSYTFTGLQPLTMYELRVRQDCTADSIGFSAWNAILFRTDTMPCVAPDTFGVIGTTNATATFAWLPSGDETAWEIFVWNNTWDSLYSVTTNPVTVSGFTAGVTYNATIRALCGPLANFEGEWGDTVQFTAATCAPVTGLATSNVTSNSVTLTWTAVTGALGYRVVCTDGQNYDTVTVTAPTHTFTGLYDATPYTFYVQTMCGAGWYSENWAQVTATTTPSTGTNYFVTTSVNNAAYGSVSGGGSHPANSTVTLTATPNTGYSFTRWNDNVTTNPRSFVVTSDTSFMAYFSANQYTVTVVNANPTMGAVTGTGTYAYNTTATITATPNSGYHFTGWNDGDTHTTRVITVTCDTTFTAGFAPNQYTVTAVPNDASMGTVTGSGTYDYGTTATLTATPNTGYGFRGWSDGNTSNPRNLVVTGDISLTANFSDDTSAITEYTVTLTVNDPAMGSLSDYGGTYAEGSTIVVTATPNAGYHFVNWSDNNTDNPRTFIVNSDITLQANFAQNVDSTAVLNIVVEGNGRVTVNGDETSIYRGRLGEVVTLVAEAYEGAAFRGWSDGNTDATRSFTLTENNATLTATFGSVGIDAVATASCTLYPNPAKGATTVSVTGISGKVRITVLDLSGREVLAETLECSADCEKSLDIEGLAEGAYFVRITSEQTAPMVKKLIVR